MEKVLDKVKENNLKEKLQENYEKNYKDEFKEIADSINKPIEEKIKNTSIIKKCAQELKNCNQCKSIFDCKNKIQGYRYMPIDNTLDFGFVICNFKKEINDSIKYQKNIYYNSIPESLKNASLGSDIYLEYKERFDAIKWINKFVREYFKSNEEKKGLYLHGNFGCGKTYLITAAFNELAKKGIKCAIVFYPEFLRDLKASFSEDFKEKYDLVKNVELLLLDDIGAENSTDWARDEILCPLIQYRMENKLTTFFTSNLNMEELESHFSKSKTKDDPLKSRRIIERIKQMTFDIEMLSENLRN